MSLNEFIVKYDAYIVLLISGIFYFLWYLMFRKRRSIVFKIKNITNIINSKHTEIEGIKIEFQKQEINYLDVWRITFKNNGNIPISFEQIKKPILINFEPGGLIQHNIESDPIYNLEITSKADENNVEITFELLNSGDSFELIAYCIFESNISVSTKMEGINTIKRAVERDYFNFILPILLLLLLLFGLIRNILLNGTTLTYSALVLIALLVLGVYIRKIFLKKFDSIPYGWRVKN